MSNSCNPPNLTTCILFSLCNVYCKSANVMYLFYCRVCDLYCVGESKQSLQDTRFWIQKLKILHPQEIHDERNVIPCFGKSLILTICVYMLTQDHHQTSVSITQGLTINNLLNTPQVLAWFCGELCWYYLLSFTCDVWLRRKRRSLVIIDRLNFFLIFSKNVTSLSISFNSSTVDVLSAKINFRKMQRP